MRKERYISPTRQKSLPGISTTRVEDGMEMSTIEYEENFPVDHHPPHKFNLSRVKQFIPSTIMFIEWCMFLLIMVLLMKSIPALL